MLGNIPQIAAFRPTFQFVCPRGPQVTSNRSFGHLLKLTPICGSPISRAKKADKLFSHKLSVPPFVPGIVPGTNWVCPRDKPGFAGLPVCKIWRKSGFVPGFHRVCPKDKPGEIPGTNPGSSQDQPDQKVYVYVPFSCLTIMKLQNFWKSAVENKRSLKTQSTRGIEDRFLHIFS